MDRRIFSRVKWLVTGKSVLLVSSMASISLTVALASCATQKGGVGPAKPASTSDNGKIAFASLDNRVGDFDIFVVEPDGGGLRKLSTKPGQDNRPAWSPDGERLAFEASQNDDLDVYVINVEGSGLERVTKEPATNDSMPSWSPDSTRIAFMRDARSVYEPDTGDIYTTRADGTSLRQLTDGGWDEYPAWSPDGKKIAFDRLTKTGGGIYTVNADGGGLRKLTDPPQGFWDSEPSWSPDGTEIAFTRGSGGRPGRPDVFTMKADGTHLRKLTGETQGAYSPDFSPDGKWIVFVGWKGGNKLYVMSADGTSVRRLTKTQAAIIEDAPDWQPLPSP